jgi:hypothetical protein
MSATVQYGISIAEIAAHQLYSDCGTPTVRKRRLEMMSTKIESPGKKPTTPRKTTVRKTRSAAAELSDDGVMGVLESIDPNVRRQLVATEAYFLAERRGFVAGNELADWVAAEALVDSRLHQLRVA